MWTHFDFTLNPNDFGWEETTDGFSVKLQDTRDSFFTLPIHVLEGCGCKNVCGTACKCLKSKERGNKCTILTCRQVFCFTFYLFLVLFTSFILNHSYIFLFRKCKCFKRERESEDENLAMSTQCQQFLDDLSSSDESFDSSQHNSLTSISENNLSDHDDIYEIFNERF